MKVVVVVQVKDYHERQYADTQTAGPKDGQLSPVSLTHQQQGEQLATAAVAQLSTAGGHHEDDRLEIAKDGLGLILERSDKQCPS